MIEIYMKFISQSSSLTCPLSDLTKKNVKKPLSWDNQLMQKFEKWKHVLSSDPILKLSDTDTSTFSLGAVLLQYADDHVLPVAYACRKLLERESILQSKRLTGNSFWDK